MSKHMTTTEAAKIIGCSPQHVRYLVSRGWIKATRRRAPGGYYNDITKEEAEKYRDTVQVRGFPRGQKRKIVVK